MEYRHLGRTGLKVSALSYGAWVTMSYQVQAVKQAAELLAACRDAGCNFFDNAEVYAKGDAEILMGKAIKELGWKRSDLVLTTKIFWGGEGPNDIGLSRKHVIEGTKASLRRMGVDYVDVLFAHRPDPNTPIEETVRAFNHCIDHGWAFYWGTSEWSAEQINEAWAVADRLDLIGPSCEQPQYNLFERTKVEREFVPLYDSRGLGLTTWSPLASGVLTGKYSGGDVPAGSRFTVENYAGLRDRWLTEKKHQLEGVDRLVPIASELGCSLAQLALAWCLRNERVSTVITGATSAAQVRENFRALEVAPKLTPELLARIDAAIGDAAAPAADQ
ncbi:voltage-gated potassium channel subunit beta-like [Raphidocelis subcapitata]|uniref:Voltage-gated potassium channel subunit beta-like n=1 Tax=Raphidocelis subcapitata TaxID=307507 RepID=A0A2V0P1G8_9CHLO|nr:voltage-gated potassium channel subunit beta-like [Raphidocelis subcapitata]|eukprot:GBF90935.1 voltage-gated potassium channel subunit beta-like [Raphidocelis subcapitata]